MRRLVQRAGVCACASIFVVAIAPATAVSQRSVTIALSGSGRAFWKLDAKTETGRLTLRYRWHGIVRFDIPLPMLRDARHRGLTVSRVATLVAGWSGFYRDRRSGVLSTCTYSGARVRSAVVARLATGRRRGTLELTFHPRSRRGFFADQGKRATIRCNRGTTQSAPPHFAPSWFFRDNLQDRGRLTSQTAVLVLPATLLPRGSATLTFPFERGRNDSVAVGRLAWNNRGTTSVEAR